MNGFQSITIGNCSLYHGDALEILPTLRERPALAVIDPPYMDEFDIVPELREYVSHGSASPKQPVRGVFARF